jgi:hypothetical protein
VLLDNFLRVCELLRLEAVVGEQLDGRFDPELGLAAGVLHVDMCSRFTTSTSSVAWALYLESNGSGSAENAYNVGGGLKVGLRRRAPRILSVSPRD